MSYKHILWILLILVLGAVVRFHDIGKKSLWLDEFYSLRIAAGHVERNSNKVEYSPLGVIPNLRNGTDLPLYFMLLNLCIRALGNSEAAMRSLSAVFGIGAILLIYLVARELLKESAGLTSAFIFALAPLHVYYAQEARAYAMEVFLVLLSTYFFIKIVFSKEEKRTVWLGYLISSLLGIYTHYFVAFIHLSYNLFLILCRRDLFFTKRWLLSQSALASAWLLLFLTMFNLESFDWVQTEPPVGSYWPYVAFPFALGKFTFADYSMKIMSISPLAFIMGILLFGALFLSGIVALIKGHGSQKVLFLFTWLCVPILALIAVDIVEKTNAVTLSRYLIAASPAYYIILSSSITAIKNKYLKISTLAFVLALFSLALSQYYAAPKFDQWREAVQYIDRSSARADLLIFYPGNFDFIKYYAERHITERVIHKDGASELENINKDLNLIFIMIKLTSQLTNPNDLDQIAGIMGTYYHLAEVRQWRGVKVLKYEKK